MNIINFKYHCIFILILSITVTVIWPGLDGPLVFDDFKNLSQLINDSQVDYKKFIFENKSGPLGRSVSMISFAFNYWLEDELVIFNMKLTNLLIHLVNGTLLYGLLIILLKPIYATRPCHLLALVIAGCWLLTPFNTGTVLYTIQRMAVLETSFIFLGCLSYVLARNITVISSYKRKIFFLVAFLCWPLALLSKENGILLPVFILLIEVCFYDAIRSRFKNVKLNQWALYSASIIVAGVLLISLLNGYGYLNYELRDYTLAERLYTQPIIILDYFSKIVLPLAVDSGLFNDDYKIRSNLWNFHTLFAYAVLIIICAISLILLKHDRYRHLVFGILFFILGHSVESTILPLEMYFQHRNYLPSAGLFYSLIIVLHYVLTETRIRQLLTPLVITYVLFLGYASYQKSNIWSAWHLIVANAYTNHPESVRANLTTVELLMRQGDFRSGLLVNDQILQLKPAESFRPRIQRLYLYCELAESIPESEYARFGTEFDNKFRVEVSSALSNLLESYKRNNCSFIDLDRIVMALSAWLDEGIANGDFTADYMWYIEYYIVEFLFVIGNDIKAHDRLIASAALGGQGAQYYLDEILSGGSNTKK
ncbi:MAG: hypothetical protein ACI9ZT_000758 [Gammaproteobacteria bacterium]|jgi:hypothetical protein